MIILNKPIPLLILLFVMLNRSDSISQYGSDGYMIAMAWSTNNSINDSILDTTVTLKDPLKRENSIRLF